MVDTPGIRSFGLGWVEPDRVVEAFDDLAGGLADCPRGCTHTADSPGCGLDAWVAAGHAGPREQHAWPRCGVCSATGWPPRGRRTRRRPRTEAARAV